MPAPGARCARSAGIPGSSCSFPPWLCYFKALQLGDVSKVAPLDKLSVPLAMLLGVLVLGEPCDPKTVAGGILITAGALLLVL